MSNFSLILFFQKKMKEAEITPAKPKIIIYADAPVKKTKFRSVDRTHLTPRKLVMQ